MFDTFIQRFLVRQGGDRVGPMVEQTKQEVKAQPSQHQQEPQAVAPGLKLAFERFMKRNSPVFEGTVDIAVAEE